MVSDNIRQLNIIINNYILVFCEAAKTLETDFKKNVSL